jgi:hypothetical protein
MSNSKILKILPILFLAIFAACDVVPDADRKLEMDEVVPQKNVLLLDFTDQQCINCPLAAVVIDTLQKNYGSAVVAVSIHTSRVSLPLVTQEGKKYDEKFGINYTHPNAVIDGLGVYINDLWNGEVFKRFNIPAKINLEIKTGYDEATQSLDIYSTISNSVLSEKIKYQLWITEDSIVDWQLIAAAKYNYEYVHNHVFRTSVNGFAGEDLTLTNGETALKHSYTVTDGKWIPRYLAVVGFIYNASSDEVYDVKQSYLFEN